MGLVLSLREINEFYEHYFTKPPPVGMSFEQKMKALVAEIGVEKLVERKYGNGQRYLQQVVPVTTPEGGRC